MQLQLQLGHRQLGLPQPGSGLSDFFERRRVQIRVLPRSQRVQLKPGRLHPDGQHVQRDGICLLRGNGLGQIPLGLTDLHLQDLLADALRFLGAQGAVALRLGLPHRRLSDADCFTATPRNQLPIYQGFLKK